MKSNLWHNKDGSFNINAMDASHETLIGSYLIASPQQAPSLTTIKPKGATLQEALSSSPKHVLLAAIDTLCFLLSHLHQRSIIHCNLHPGHVLLSSDGTVALGGFESAYFENSATWASQQRIKRLGYVAPEIAREEESIDRRADLFSFGVILYEVLTGQTPFPGENDHARLLATLENDPTPPEQISPGISSTLSALCLRLLSKSPDERPYSIVLVQGALLGAGVFDWANATTIGMQEATLLPRRSIASPITPPPISDIPSAPERSTTKSQTPKLHEVAPSQYEMQGELARGGLGKITRAIDKRLDRLVAVKSLLADKGTARDRFLREAFLTAKLQHPSIIPIYEAGVWPDGSPFYSMRLVSGQPLHQEIARRKQMQERLTLLPNVIDAIEAVAYAHAERVIHRDIKPHNILVGDFGETVVIDWGLAKIRGTTEQAEPKSDAYREENGSDLTATGAILGTPAYMPPEQAEGKEVDERADVYSLGAVLYHLLSGEPPYRGKKAIEALKALLLSPPTPLSQKQPELPRDLIAIVEKSMARSPHERYPSAKELADDLKKFQAGQLVGVYQYTFPELLRRWFHKHRLTISIAALLLMALVVGGVYSYVQVDAQRRKAESNEAKARQEKSNAEARNNSLILMQARNALYKDRNLTLAWLKTLLPNTSGWSGARLLAEEASLRGGILLSTFHRDAKIMRGEFSFDGEQLCTIGEDQSLQVLYTKDNSTRDLTGPQAYFITKLLFSPTEHLLAVTGEKDIHLWETTRGEERRLSGHQGVTHDIAFSSDGALLASASADKTVRLWDLTQNTSRLLSGNTDMVSLLTFSPDGKMLAAAGADHVIYLWDLSTGASSVLTGNTAPIFQMRFSPDQRFFITAGADALLRIWDVKDHVIAGEPRQILRGHLETISDFIFSPDGKTLASASHDNTVRLWDLTGEEPSRALPPHEGNVSYIAFSPDGKTLFDAAGDGVRAWDLQAQTKSLLVGADSFFSFIRVSPDGRFAAVGNTQRGDVSLWSLGGKRERVVSLPQDVAFLASFSPDGSMIAIPQRSSRDVHIYRSDTKELIALSNASSINEVRFSPAGDRLAIAGSDGALHIWRTSSLKESPQLLSGHQGEIRALQYSPDGSLLASGGDDGVIRLWGLDGESRVLTTNDGAISSLLLMADGRSLISASETKVLLWDLTSGSSSVLCELPSAPSTRLSLSPDQSLLAWAGRDHRVYLFSLAEKKLRALSGHKGEIYLLAFSTSGELASVSFDRSIRIWDLKTGLARIFSGHTGPVRALAFSSDGSLLFSAGQDRSLRVWDVAAGTSRVVSEDAGHITQLLLSPTNDALLSVGLRWEARLWRLPLTSKESSHLVESVPAPYSWVDHDYLRRVVFSPDREWMATSNYDERVRLVRLKDGSSRLLTGHTDYVNQMAFSADSKRLATASLDQTIRIWDLARDESYALDTGPLQSPVLSLAFSPDGGQLVFADEPNMNILDLQSGQRRAIEKGVSALVQFVFSRDGKRIAGAPYDGSVRTWDLPSGEMHLMAFGFSRETHSVALSPDGKRLVSGSLNRVVRVWDAERDEILYSFSGHEGEIWSVDFSPDGSLIASASADGTARVWDVESGESLILEGHTGGVLGVAFSTDGDTIITVGEDQSIRYWRLSLPKDPSQLHSFLMKSTLATLSADRTTSFDYPTPTYKKALRSCSEEPKPCTQQELPMPGFLSVAEIDWEGDRDMDLLVVRQDAVMIELNDGAGRFPKEQKLLDAPGVSEALSADLDADGDLELVVLSASEDRLSVFWNDAGRFEAPSSFAVADSPGYLIAADLNEDGYLDLALSHYLTDQVGILFQSEPGTFKEPILLSSGFNPMQLAAADIDGDRDSDLIVDDWRTGIGVFVNQGAGVFSPRRDIFVGNHYWRVQPGDIDQDGDLDLVTINISSGRVVSLYNDGKGRFLPVLATGLPRQTDLSLRDIDGDDDLDMIIASGEYGAVWIMSNEGGSHWIKQRSIATFAKGAEHGRLLLSELNHDQSPELILTTKNPAWFGILSF
jgi:WD40 repeat protein/serine/threonine protein kinase